MSFLARSAMVSSAAEGTTAATVEATWGAWYRNEGSMLAPRPSVAAIVAGSSRTGARCRSSAQQAANFTDIFFPMSARRPAAPAAARVGARGRAPPAWGGGEWRDGAWGRQGQRAAAAWQALRFAKQRICNTATAAWPNLVSNLSLPVAPASDGADVMVARVARGVGVVLAASAAALACAAVAPAQVGARPVFSRNRGGSLRAACRSPLARSRADADAGRH